MRRAVAFLISMFISIGCHKYGIFSNVETLERLLNLSGTYALDLIIELILI